MGIPIVFIHRGYNTYLEFTLRQAHQMSPQSEIILLGDSANARFDFVTHIHLEDYSQQASEFAKLYQHRSTNPYAYELFCLQRWFILWEYAQTLRYSELWTCDSDVMLYADMDVIHQHHLRNADIAIHRMPSGSSACTAFFKSQTLQQFCSFIISHYTEPQRLEELDKIWQAVTRSRKLGGVSDMTLAHLFLQEHPDLSQRLLNEVHGDGTFDLSIHSSQDEYQMRLGQKRLSWAHEIPYGWHLQSGDKIHFYSLHLQGPAKFMTAQYYTGPAFKGHHRLAIQFFILNLAAKTYHLLKIRHRLKWLFSLYFRWFHTPNE